MKLRVHGARERRPWRSIVFVVALVAGVLGVAVPPAAAQVVCVGFIGGRTDGQDQEDDSFEIRDECADEFAADESATSSGPDGSATATASHQHSFIFEPDGHLSSADAVGSVSASIQRITTFPLTFNAHSDISDLSASFEIPEGSIGSVFGSVRAETTGTDPGGADDNFDAFSQLSVNGPVDDSVSVQINNETPVTRTDSLGVNELPPGQYDLEAKAQALVGASTGTDGSLAFGATAGFDVTITVESDCDNEFTDGDDIITGTPDFDFLCGGAGNDVIEGEGDGDIILGGAGNDFLSGGDGNDTLEGGDGDDIIVGGAGGDGITGGDGDDGDDIIPLSGGDGIDIIDGGDGTDQISGGDGNDTLDGGPGPLDFLEGDLGNDTIDGGGGTRFDTLDGCNDTDPLCDANQADLDAAGVTDEDILLATGNAGSILVGGSAKDKLFGAAGFDEIHGGRGNDFIDAAGDRDLLFGDQGDDFILGGPGHESGSQSGDPRAIFGGPGDDDIFGGPGDDLIEGEAGKDDLSGAAGSDKLRGQGDNDCLTGGTRHDVLAGGPGRDRLFARDGVNDVVNGGPQFDRARVDGVDDLIRVENDNFQGGCP